jgi:hypothetical protein
MSLDDGLKRPTSCLIYGRGRGCRWCVADCNGVARPFDAADFRPEVSKANLVSP